MAAAAHCLVASPSDVSDAEASSEGTTTLSHRVTPCNTRGQLRPHAAPRKKQYANTKASSSRSTSITRSPRQSCLPDAPSRSCQPCRGSPRPTRR